MATPGLAPASKPSRFLPYIKRVENTPPALVLGAFLLLGVLLLVGSIIARVNSVYFAAEGKQVGYFYEINWSWNFVLFIPISLYFCSQALNSVRQVIKRLSDSGMVIDSKGNAVSYVDLINNWHDLACRWAVVGLFLVLAVLAGSWIEWARVCVWPLMLNKAIGETLLPGWNIAPRGTNGDATPLGTVIFGATAFTVQGVVAGAFMSFITSVLAFSHWISRFTSDDTTQELIPNLKSGDTRLGFENFARFVESLLFASVSFFFVFFMTRLDFLCVSSPTRDIGSFVKGDIAAGFFHGVKDLFTKFDSSLFDIGSTIGYSTAMVAAGLCITIAVAFIVPIIIVRQSASDSRDRFRSLIQQNPAILTATGVTIAEAGTRLSEMTFWPLKYPAPIQLTLITILAGGCFVFYKLTLVLIGVILAIALNEFLKAVRGS